MKKITLVIITSLFAFGLTAQSNKEMLCKKWTIDVDALIASVPEMAEMMKIMPDDQKALMKEKMGAVRVEFFKNGTMESSQGDGGAVKNGTWEFIENGAAIKSITGEEQKERIMEIVELSSDSMTVKERGKEKEPAMIMIPAVD